MRTVGEIRDKLFELAPEEMKESWDNVGLLCGRADRPVEKILVALDVFPDVIAEARELGVQLIVSHHPVLFGELRAVSDESMTGRAILDLAESGIASINLHTNLDSAPGGVNDRLAELLRLRNIAVLCESGTNGQGRPFGLGRIGEHSPCTLTNFLSEVKTVLGCGGLRYADAGRTVRRVAVGGGACGEFLEEAARKGCDTFVTGDLKYNHFEDAVELGVNLIDAGHFPTENPVCTVLENYLQESFPDLSVVRSKKHTDVVKFF